MTPDEIDRRIGEIRARFLVAPFRSGTERALSDLADQAVSEAWGSERGDEEPSAKWKTLPASWAALAVGGYGRRELHPGSDLDFLFFFSGPPPGEVWERRKLSALSGIPFPAEGHAASESDFLSFDPDQAFIDGALLDSRFLFGDPDLARSFTERVFAQFLERHRFQLIRALVVMRTRRGGDSAPPGFLDLKNAPGGLADFRWIRWIGRLDARNGRLTDADRERVEAAASTLRAVRTALNFLFPEAGNVLGRAHAPDVARALGIQSAGQADEARLKALCREATNTIRGVAEGLSARCG